ncbi:putative leucine-rich repeat protein (LRRP) [Trypanosoma conorhini]|uniref:Putative leucine-rich repeat protein (LRRP) n=1 Tax=Trypanosoma conorhini TaxID=83891 RepID=A0A422Q948_9TRYP|nr:putative leucine-rich repeat protein (LRRP) [Trypanosoma conorhini]RNF26502.1 putative leucine-rich repeat protein (LRRP) [Trypanosoma conorhini]
MADEHDGATARRDEISSAVVEHLRSAVRQAMKDQETAEVVELLCENSGWTVEDFLQAPHELKALEVFLLSTPELPQLRLFPYLTVVKIIHVGLESMRSLSYLHHVEELWLNENNIRRIEGLHQMQRLRRLFLQGNRIETMSDIPHLPLLQELWLCGNQLRHITGLNLLPALTSLWVASNRIATLDNAFTASMASIEELNLSSNRIYFLGQLTHLGVLKSLRRVWFSDPMYGDAPICHLSNYTTFSLRHLLQLEQLDGVAITAEQRSLAISVYAKKSIYYSMRRAILDRNVSILLARMQQEVEAKRNVVRKALRQINLEITALSEAAPNGSPATGGATEEEQGHVSKLRQARDRGEVELEGLERQLLDAQERTGFEYDSLHERLLLELNSCGNIRLEEGSPEDAWCANAKELVASRFDAALYESLGVTGVKVNRVFRIMCQGLRERFDNRMRELDVDLVDTRNRRALVRLFSAVPKNLTEQRRFLHEVMINGFSGLYAEDDGVPLTNSLYYADQERLMLTKTKHRDVYGVRVPLESFSGQLVVSRLFLGKCVSEMGASREQEANGEVPFMKSERRRCTRRQYGDEVFSIYRAAPHDASVKVWHMFEKSLVLPEYVIDFTYTTKLHRLNSPLLSVYDDLAALRARIEKIVPEEAPDSATDIRTVGYPLLSFLQWLDSGAPHVFANEETDKMLRSAQGLRQTKTVAFQVSGILTNELIEAYKSHVSPAAESLMVLCDMSGQQITCIPASLATTKLWASLTHLFLPDNKISSIAWESLALVAPALEKLDLCNNVLNSLDFAAAHFPVLHWLCLSFNRLHALEDLLPLREGLPRLESLDMDHNPWMANKLAEVYCFAVLPQLQHLNGISPSRHASLLRRQKRTFAMDQGMLQYIVAEERRRQTQDNVGVFMTQTDLDQMSSEDVVKIVSFEAVFAELMEKTEKDRACLVSANRDPPAPPLRSVRSFCFRFSLMRGLAWLSLLPQLRHLCLQSHVIEDLSPLAELRHLRTLNVSGNLVKTAKPLAGLRLLS